jgi:hypothetical protein
MTTEERLAQLNELLGEDTNVPYPTDLADAIIGIVEQFDKPPVVLLDRDKCIEILQEQWISYEEAEEHLNYNVIVSYIGDQTPMFATLIKED